MRNDGLVLLLFLTSLCFCRLIRDQLLAGDFTTNMRLLQVTHTHSHKQIHTHTHTLSDARTHSLTHTHTHIFLLTCVLLFFRTIPSLTFTPSSLKRKDCRTVCSCHTHLGSASILMIDSSAAHLTRVGSSGCLCVIEFLVLMSLR